MKRRVLLAASTILVTIVGPGCEDAAKKPAQAHVPGTPAAAAHVAAPSPTWQSQTAQQPAPPLAPLRSEEHTSELQSHSDLVCRLLLEKKKCVRRAESNYEYHNGHAIGFPRHRFNELWTAQSVQ